jgi:predicted nucleotidyltransferase
MSARPAIPHTTEELDANTAFYRHVLQTLTDADVPFLVGGAFAFAAFTGIERMTKDLDLFIRRADHDRIAELTRGIGYRAELTYPHWLAKVYAGDAFIDLIFNSGNGVLPVDNEWLAHAADGQVFGLPVKIAPAEESIASKAFIMERERFDGADVAHLLRARAHVLDWTRLLHRFGKHWRVLLAHLVIFGFIYPADRALVPAWLMDDLLARLREELAHAPPATKLCAGTLLSREQYLHDVERGGLEDARAVVGTMTEQDISDWTRAIPGRRDSGG